MIDELKDISLHSLYHHSKDEEQGKESQETFFLQRNKNKNYHTDYVFLNHSKLEKSQIEIIKSEFWLEFSDHAPILFEVSH